eukprot:420707-Prorocentrum_minimum.AAC.1
MQRDPALKSSVKPALSNSESKQTSESVPKVKSPNDAKPGIFAMHTAPKLKPVIVKVNRAPDIEFPPNLPSEKLVQHPPAVSFRSHEQHTEPTNVPQRVREDDLVPEKNAIKARLANMLNMRMGITTKVEQTFFEEQQGTKPDETAAADEEGK